MSRPDRASQVERVRATAARFSRRCKSLLLVVAIRFDRRSCSQIDQTLMPLFRSERRTSDRARVGSDGSHFPFRFVPPRTNRGMDSDRRDLGLTRGDGQRHRIKNGIDGAGHFPGRETGRP
jgi:hypothetical protein